MGLFDFVKDAGSKIFQDSQETSTETVTVSPERLSELRSEHILKKMIEAGLDTDGIQVAVQEGERVTLSGKTSSQEACEKMVLIAGNQFGITQVNCQIEVAEQASASRMYTVKSGDTLSGIARELYGDASKYPLIFEANQPMLTDPNKIYPGQVLRIPEQA